MATNQRDGHSVALCPKEFLKVHRQHFQRVLFRRNQNFLAALCDGCERSSFQNVVTPVLQQGFHGLARLRKQLNLVEDDQRFAFVQIRSVEQLKNRVEIIQVSKTVDEQVFDIVTRLIKTNQDVSLIRFSA